MRRIESWLVLGLISFLWVGGAQADDPKNVILIIGDGFGFEQAEAGRLLVPDGELVLDDLDPNPGSVDVSNFFGEITDSAAAATALATGVKTANGNISMDWTDTIELPTSMQAAQAEGMAVGILSSVYLCDATPGVWVAHATSRSCSTIIPQQIDACPDVFLGPGEPEYRRGGKGKKTFDFIADLVENCDYEEVTNAAELAAATAPDDRLLGIWGGYSLTYTIDRQNDPGSNTVPTLAQMIAKAIDVLSRDPDGFMLVAECGAIDWMSHNKDIAGTARDVVACDEAIAVAYEFAKADEHTALIITADHETGGLDLGDNPDADFIKGITASTAWMWGQVHREDMDVEDVLETYAGVTDLTPTEMDAIAAYGEMAISDALSDRAGVVWGAPGIPARAPDEGNHSDFLIPVWAYGPGTGGLEGNIQNTDIGNKIFDLVD